MSFDIIIQLRSSMECQRQIHIFSFQLDFIDNKGKQINTAIVRLPLWSKFIENTSASSKSFRKSTLKYFLVAKLLYRSKSPSACSYVNHV